MKSRAQSSVPQKNRAVPSGAATEVRSASPGARSRGRLGASSASARSAERIGSALSTAIAGDPRVRRTAARG
jgi:hypothetical protein